MSNVSQEKSEEHLMAVESLGRLGGGEFIVVQPVYFFIFNYQLLKEMEKSGLLF